MAAKVLVAIFVIFASMFTVFPASTNPLPFVLFHGIADECSSARLQNFTATLRKWSGAQGSCIEIGNGFMDSFFMPIEKQIEVACKKVKSMKELSAGYNLVAESQGNMVGRGLIQTCDGGPPVKNYIALAGPHAGVASPPLCNETQTCVLEANLIRLGVYTKFVQERLAPAGYIKIPTDIEGYMKGCVFLPRLNNEISGQKNSLFKKRFSRLQNLVLIKFEQDQTLIPRETSWFGHYEDGSWNKILPVQQTKLYTEDRIGLRTLDKAGKVKFINVTGDHLQISFSDLQKHVFPYLRAN
ncbi:uncharacterized protein LOC108217797 [Daucus carota subsp. sativus]|uniref:uncharacterized protein LOC108217797 n=1 Tax=Daucus carota subsp. sativus TaxID=79200 RepID=UPI0007F03449|nr:PREDICTED: palmitoyl-protein thioesterase 1 [Daucus carota subsp. sativus]